MTNASTEDATTNGINNVNSGGGDNGPLIRRATFDTSKPSSASSSSSKRRGSASGWGLVKQSVNEPKTDLWNAIFDAVGGDKEEHVSIYYICNNIQAFIAIDCAIIYIMICSLL